MPGLNWLAKHDGQDRWYLEGLGIGADLKWDACLNAYLAKVGAEWAQDAAARDIVWRSRATQTPKLLAALITDPATEVEHLARYLRALDFQAPTARARRGSAASCFASSQ